MIVEPYDDYDSHDHYDSIIHFIILVYAFLPIFVRDEVWTHRQWGYFWQAPPDVVQEILWAQKACTRVG